MREILFRGKRVDNGAWVYGSLVTFGNRTIIVCHIDCMRSDEAISASEYFEFDYVEVVPETVGQYTGLKDKNGVKIFEGDILQTHFEFSPGDAGYNDSQRPFVVGWDKDRMCFRGWKPGIDRHSYKLLEIIDFFGKQEEVYEVIGNIYDNPELLEV